MINYLLAFSLLIIAFSINTSAQAQKPWPYIKGIEEYYRSDSTGKYLLKIYNRSRNNYNKYGMIINMLSEQNKSSDPFGKLDTTSLDSMQYDTKNRLLEKKTYALTNGFISEIQVERNQYFDSIKKSSYIRKTYKNGNLQSEKWNTLYKGKNELDSLTINGNGAIINNKYTSQTRYYYTNKRMDSSYYDTYDASNQIWQPLSKNNYSYLPGDTVLSTSYSFLSKKSTVSKRVYDIEGRLFFEEYGNFRIYYLLYNKNGQLKEKKIFLYDANAKKYLIANHTLNNYDSNGAIVYILDKSYSSGIFMDGGRKHFIYTPFPPDPPKVTAGFTANNACEGQETGFTNTSTAGTDSLTYTWNFGDGNTSTLNNPVHKFAAPGKYEVKLIAVSSSELRDTFTAIVNVFSAPSANFTSSANTKEINFTPADTALAFYEWDFGDGNTSMLTRPVHNYTTEGRYLVKLKVKNDDGCESEFADSVIVKTIGINGDLHQVISLNVFPNPFHKQTNITYNLQKASKVKISLYDLQGKETVIKTEHNQTPGNYSFIVNTKNLNLKAGIYLLRIIMDDEVISKQIIKFE